MRTSTVSKAWFARALAGLALGLACAWTPAQAAVDDAASVECVSCHDEDELPDMSRSAHGAKGDPRSPGCVTCHGASPTHVKKPQGMKERPAPDRVFSRKGGSSTTERNAACLSCHDRDAKRAHWRGSAHESSEVPCSACHKVHTNHDKVMAKATQTEVCTDCHKEQRNQIHKPSRHPLAEGRMSCSDCHNAHGSAGPKLARRDSTNDTCFGCHAEKRGPFVHPHEPATEDCASCHNPHGSTVAAMLKSRPPILCQQCHTPHVAGGVGAVGGQRGVFPPAAPGQVSPAIGAMTPGKNVLTMWQGRSCTNCHTQVHGTNNPSATNPTPGFHFR